jgi:hypothetical protein
VRFTGWITDSKAYIQAILICEEHNIREPVVFCVDTGASSTCLSERDVVEIGIDLRELQETSVPAVGIGGTAKRYILKNAKLEFVGHDQGWVEDFREMSVISCGQSIIQRLIAILCRILHVHGLDMQGIPSLLGFDFLRKCNISFSEDEVYLDLVVTGSTGSQSS